MELILRVGASLSLPSETARPLRRSPRPPGKGMIYERFLTATPQVSSSYPSYSLTSSQKLAVAPTFYPTSLKSLEYST